MLKADEQRALEMMAKVFNWLDCLESRLTMESVPPTTPKKAQDSAMSALLAGGTRILSAVGMGGELETCNQPQPGTGLVNLLRKAGEVVQEGVGKVRRFLTDE